MALHFDQYRFHHHYKQDRESRRWNRRDAQKQNKLISPTCGHIWLTTCLPRVNQDTMGGHLGGDLCKPNVYHNANASMQFTPESFCNK